MGQDVIWDHFQNEGAAAFDGAGPRLEYLVRQLGPGERVLDIGVGSGALEALASRKGVEMWAIDPSERSIAQLREDLGLGDRAQVGYAEEAPFPSNHFDAVVMTEVLEHLDEKTRTATVAEVYRLLKPGGRFLGTVPARERLEVLEVVCPNCSHHFHRWGHQSSFTVESLGAILRERFSVDTIHERFFNEWDSAGVGRRAAGLLKKFLSWRGIGPYGVARNIYFCVRKSEPL
jgi:ubiquinone/menaquinone biosynthesis C-methylase UbiE